MPKPKRAGSKSLVVEYPRSKHKALSSNPSIEKKKEIKDLSSPKVTKINLLFNTYVPIYTYIQVQNKISL
jgi:hypothetical protein